MVRGRVRCRVRVKVRVRVRVRVRCRVRVEGEFEDTPDINFDGILDFEENTSRTVDSQILVDLQVGYNMSENLRIVLGANNLLDEEPPFAIGNGDSDLYGYVGGVHNPRGRFLYSKLSFRF